MPDTTAKERKPDIHDEWGDLDDEILEAANDLEDLDEPAAPAVDPAKSEQIVQSALKAADAAGAQQNFTAGRKGKKKSKFKRSDQLRTGRNQHIGLRGRIEDKERLSAIADQREWVHGQTLQYALDALQEKIGNPEDEFWQSHKFYGVE